MPPGEPRQQAEAHARHEESRPPLQLRPAVGLDQPGRARLPDNARLGKCRENAQREPTGDRHRERSADEQQVRTVLARPHDPRIADQRRLEKDLI